MYSFSSSRWAWMGGLNSLNFSGVYGTLGVPASGNYPGARYGHALWFNYTSNCMFVFGGKGYDAVGTTSI